MKVKRWQDLQIVEVVWEDAAADFSHEGSLDNPKDADKFGGFAPCRDVGYLIRKNRKEVVVAWGLMTEDNSYRHSNTIPRSWIKEIIVLSRPSYATKQNEDDSSSQKG